MCQSANVRKILVPQRPVGAQLRPDIGDCFGGRTVARDQRRRVARQPVQHQENQGDRAGDDEGRATHPSQDEPHQVRH
jgi:hypothetical protein